MQWEGKQSLVCFSLLIITRGPGCRSSRQTGSSAGWHCSAMKPPEGFYTLGFEMRQAVPPGKAVGGPSPTLLPSRRKKDVLQDPNPDPHQGSKTGEDTRTWWYNWRGTGSSMDWFGSDSNSSMDWYGHGTDSSMGCFGDASDSSMDWFERGSDYSMECFGYGSDFSMHWFGCGSDFSMDWFGRGTDASLGSTPAPLRLQQSDSSCHS